MTNKEKLLYHQIHPVKLSVDITSCIITTTLAWHHNIIWFLILSIPPSVIATFLIVKFTNLEPYKDSKVGKYIAKYMSPTIHAIRGGGQIIMWIAAWYRIWILIAAGLVIIILAWCNGLIKKQ